LLLSGQIPFDADNKRESLGNQFSPPRASGVPQKIPLHFSVDTIETLYELGLFSATSWKQPRSLKPVRTERLGSAGVRQGRGRMVCRRAGVNAPSPPRHRQRVSAIRGDPP